MANTETTTSAATLDPTRLGELHCCNIDYLRSALHVMRQTMTDDNLHDPAMLVSYAGMLCDMADRAYDEAVEITRHV